MTCDLCHEYRENPMRGLCGSCERKMWGPPPKWWRDLERAEKKARKTGKIPNILCVDQSAT